MTLSCSDIDVSIGGGPILRGITFDLTGDETLVLLGPSGSGKTTLLRVIAGLQSVDRGSIRWDGEELGGVPPHRRRFGLVFQDYALFPHLSVGRNIAFGLDVRGVASSERVADALAMVGLEGFADRRIDGLSGGEQQRVALARALVTDPRLLLLDEPLGALDAALRSRLIAEFGRLLTHVPSIYVTHDRAEAMALGDRIGVMRNGRILRIDTAEAIWTDPRDAWTARFIGHPNVLDDGSVLGFQGAISVPIRGIRLGEPGMRTGTVSTCRFIEGEWMVDVEVDGVTLVCARGEALDVGSRVGVDTAEVILLGS